MYAGGCGDLEHRRGESDICCRVSWRHQDQQIGSASFELKLTQVKILAYAVSDAAKGTRWGKIKNI